MLNKLSKLEQELYIDICMKNPKEILEYFQFGKTLQLPVLEGKQLVGILEIFAVCDSILKGEEISVRELMLTDIVVAGLKEDVFRFADSKQHILPFVDENGAYVGFVTRIVQKCYLPNKEYMRTIEEGLDTVLNHNELKAEDFKEMKHSFNAIFETNYNGIYVTVGKGKTLDINSHASYLADVTLEKAQLIGNSVKAILKMKTGEEQRAHIIQHLQKRKEFMFSESVISEGGLIRLVDNIQSFEKLLLELEESKTLAETYKDELEAMKLSVYKTDGIVAESDEMKAVLELALRVSKVSTTTLLQGESGVGKGVISKFIHDNSERREGPYVKIDCSSIPEHLLETELFGYVKGAFTDAEKKGKIGQIELANNGTVLLDEIGELPMSLQTKLLSVLQDRQIKRVGSNELIDVDIRIIAATNRDLEEMVKEKTFREDLFYRLNVVPINIPPLRSRLADITVLIEQCLKKFNCEHNMNKKIHPSALRKLIDYSWPGNVRELENVIEYLIVTVRGEIITINDLPERILDDLSLHEIKLDQIDSLKATISLIEKKILLDTIGKASSIESMGRILKLDRSTVSKKLKKYGIQADF